MAMDYPVKCFSEEVENIRGRFEAKDQHNRVVVL
jgi:hypothetical protein